MSALLDTTLALAERHADLLWLLVLISMAMLVVSLFAVPWLVLRLPADYYAGESLRPRLSSLPRVLRFPVLAIKNALGAVLLLAGVAMLFLPGQGLLTVLLALAMLDLPGKRRAERWLVSRPAVLASINWLRRRRGRPPLRVDAAGMPDPRRPTS